MTIITVKYFAFFKEKTKGICGDDFKNPEKEVLINPNYLLSLTKPEMATLPFSGKQLGYYSILTMSNDDVYYLHQAEFHKINELLNLK